MVVTDTNLDQILKVMDNTLYSEAIQNYIQMSGKNEDLKTFLKIRKDSSMLLLEDLPERLKTSIKRCKNTGVKYLLLAMQLDVSRFLSEFGASELKKEQSILNRKLYLKLIREFDHVPQPCRKIVGRTLKLNKAYNFKGDLKTFRTWSQKHLENDSDITFQTLSNAVSLSDAEVVRASETYYLAFQKALNQHDAFRILAGLNNAVSYIRETDLDRAVELSEELSFYLGVYGELHHVNLIVARTLMQVAEQEQNYDHYFEAVAIMDYFYEKLIKPVPSLKKMYYPMIRTARLKAFVRKKSTIKRDEVSNSRVIREFLKERIGKINVFVKKHGLPTTTVYRVLNGDCSVVQIKTLKRLIKVLNIEISFDNPKEINYVLRIMRAEELFEKHLEIIQKLSDDELTQRLIRGLFITLPDNTMDYRRLLSLVKDRDQLTAYLKCDASRIMFFNRCFHVDDGFYRGRQQLFDGLLETMGEHRKEINTLYTSLRTNEDMTLISRYLREYSRVSVVNLDSSVEAVLAERFSDPEYKSILSFCRKLNFDELKGYLCTCFFDDEERRRLVRLFLFVLK